uniref:Sulfhydryl oxidase n=1 Tax=Marseillevirus LCMAC101 TaxID=2506602 RepID=A0A481YQQ8_9VIRU|nr:MAG: Erv1/Alr family disulfide (thiol) oxidoreductase [Marseillevirus LCMAC101]
MSLNPNNRGKDFWGPPIWRLGHIYGITYDPSKAADFEKFWLLLCVLLPCDYCQKNLTSKLNQCSIKKYLKNRDQTFFFTYFVHDLANINITQYNSDNPKVSPHYDNIKEYYINSVKREAFWKSAFWDTLFICACTLKSHNSRAFVDFLWTSSSLLPYNFSKIFQKCLQKHQPMAYMRNHNDAFFYIYHLYNCTSPRPDMVPPFDDLKSYYFTALGKECKECSV